MFCTNCCSEKINIPKEENKLLFVCKKCKNQLSNGNKFAVESEKDISLPKNFLNLIESNKKKENDLQHSSTVSNNSAASNDCQILAMRLKALDKESKFLINVTK